jgi:hypothetical protein
MTDPTDTSTREREPLATDAAGSVTAPPKKSFARRHWGKLTLTTLIGGPLAALAIYTLIVLNFSYSDGNRTGLVQKISRKGWLCKTWEGELLLASSPGTVPEKWLFTTWSDSVAALIEQSNGKRVELKYDQHVGLWSSCFGETQYFVKGVRPLE